MQLGRRNVYEHHGAEIDSAINPASHFLSSFCKLLGKGRSPELSRGTALSVLPCHYCFIACFGLSVRTGEEREVPIVPEQPSHCLSWVQYGTHGKVLVQACSE